MYSDDQISERPSAFCTSLQFRDENTFMHCGRTCALALDVTAGVAQFGLDSGQDPRIIREMAERVRENFPRLLTDARCVAPDRDAVMARCKFSPADL